MRNIKISIRLFIVTIGLLLFIQLPTFATTGKSTVSNLRIRKTPSTDGEVIDVLGLEDKVEILGEQGDWYNISFKKVNGYVSKSYITTDEDTKENNNSEENNAQNQGSANTQTEQTNGNEQNSQGTSEENNASEPADTKQQEEKIVNKVFKIAEKTQVNILPLLTSEIIGEVNKDENVTLINNAGLWAYIQTKDYCGWIRIDKLSTENVNVDNTDTTKDNTDTNNQVTTPNNSENNNENNGDNSNNNNNNNQANYSTKTMYAKSSGINVRSESNTSSEVVTSIGINTEVKVVGEENGWYKVEVDGNNGYIRNDLLSNEKVEVSSRSNDIDRSESEKNVNTNQNSENTNINNTPQEVTSSNSVPVSSSGVSGNDIVEYAKQFLGCRYVYGAAGPSSFDCSGLTMYVYKHFGYSLSHSSKVQATQGKAVTGELQPGDILVFTNGGSAVGHVGIYIGNDKFIHASDSTTGVIISNLSDRWNKSKYVGARRIL